MSKFLEFKISLIYVYVETFNITWRHAHHIKFYLYSYLLFVKLAVICWIVKFGGAQSLPNIFVLWSHGISISLKMCSCDQNN